MIQAMTTGTDPEPTLSRVESVCQAAYRALTLGLQLADNLHKQAGWSPAADIHLHRQMTRREAMEDLKQLGPELEDDDNLGLAMSGLILNLPSDTIRIWHTTESEIPAPRSEIGRAFVTQSYQRPALFVVDGLPYDTSAPERRNGLILQWTAQGRQILRFDLVRPVGYKGGKVELDWRKSLLSDYRRTLPDIEYKRRRDDHLESGNEGGRDS
jgi:hypothetical protein